MIRLCNNQLMISIKTHRKLQVIKFEVPKLKMDSEGSKGLGFVFYTKMLEHGNKIAQIDGLTGESDTFAELLQRSVRTAIKLQEKGLTCDDVVMTCSLNYRDAFVPLFATQFLGAITSALDPTLSLKDVVHLLKQVPPKIIFVTPAVTQLIENALEEIGWSIEIVVFGPTTKHTPFSDFLEPHKLEATFRPAEIDGRSKTSMVLFSSGSTGLPKGICINHYCYVQSIKMMIRRGQAYDVNLTTTSLYWISANWFLAIGTFTGFQRILLPSFNAENVWKAIDKYEATTMFATPLQLAELGNKKIGFNANGSSIRHLITGGVSVYKAHLDIVNSAFPQAIFCVIYGQTETSMLSAFDVNNPDDLKLIRKNPTSCGKILEEYSYKIVDIETGESLGPNKPGELRIQGDILFNGYYNMDSSDSWEDGWFKTGDIVYVDEDGCVFVVDRIKEMLKFQSWHVAPAAIEQVLVTHPAVERCIVIGIPHEMDGDHPMAVVVLKKSFEGTTPEEIKEFVENQVDDRKKLRGGVKIVDTFPMMLSGKVKRKDIREMVLSGKL